MPLPRAAQAQLEAAEATLAAANQPPVATPPVEPPAPPIEPPPAPPAEVHPPVAPAPVVPPSPPADWEQKYRVADGMLRQQGRELKELRAQIAALSAPAPAPTPAPTPAPAPVADPKDVEAFGLDMVQMVKRVCDVHLAAARQEIGQALAALGAEVAQLKEKLGGTVETVQLTGQQLFFSELSKGVPDWETVNAMPEWHAYLADKDPVYDFPRQFALDDAFSNGNSRRAIAIFNAFKATLPKPSAPPPPESPSPRPAASAPPATPAGKPTYSQSEVKGFYDDVRRGLYRSNPQEKARLEAIYNAAMAEGRIV